MNKQNQQRSMRQKSGDYEGEIERKGISDSESALLTILGLVPCLLCFFYATGMWEVTIKNGVAIRDGVDDIAVALAICFGIFQIVVINVFLKRR